MKPTVHGVGEKVAALLSSEQRLSHLSHVTPYIFDASVTRRVFEDSSFQAELLAKRMRWP